MHTFSGEMPCALPTIFEYFFDAEKGKWVPWVQLIPKYIHEPDKKFNEILVPTVDTVRTTWLLGLQCTVRRPVLLVGETGTSKTATTSNFLREMDKETNVRKYKHVVMSLQYIDSICNWKLSLSITS